MGWRNCLGQETRSVFAGWWFAPCAAPAPSRAVLCDSSLCRCQHHPARAQQGTRSCPRRAGRGGCGAAGRLARAATGAEGWLSRLPGALRCPSPVLLARKRACPSCWTCRTCRGWPTWTWVPRTPTSRWGVGLGGPRGDVGECYGESGALQPHLVP